MKTHRQQPQQSGPGQLTAPNRRDAMGLTMGLLLASTLGSSNAHAQGTYPTKSVRVMVGNPAGGLGDVLGRAVAQGLTDATGKTFYVENKSGANGIIAADTVAKSDPDGYNLLFATDGMIVVNQFVFSKMPYDPNRDLMPLALVGRTALVLVVTPSSGIKTAEEFFQRTRDKDNRLNYGSGGPGHPLHLAMELIKGRLGLTLTAIPYKGSAPAVQALLAGEVSSMMCGVAEVLPHIKAGKLIPLAATGPGAQELFPNLPLLKTFNPDLDIAPWFGLFGPRGLPTDVAARLHQETNRFLGSADVKKRFGEFGVVPTPSSVADLEALISSDRKKYGPLIKSLGITVE